MTFTETVFSVTMLAQTVRMAVPYACAALGGVWSERGGVVNIALEGTLLVSGLTAVAAHVATGPSPRSSPAARSPSSTASSSRARRSTPS